MRFVTPFMNTFRALLALVFLSLPVTVVGLNLEPCNRSRLHNRDLESQAITKVPASYPAERGVRVKGKVVVLIKVDRSGNVVYARATCGHPLLASSSVAAAFRWKFSPRGVQRVGIITFEFAPNDGAPEDSHGAPGQDSKRQTHVLDSVPGPRDEAIRKIRTPKDWHNPYVMIYRDSFELILHDRPRTSERIQLAKLEKSLLDLSLERWPLGRVVAVQEIAIRSGRDDEKIARNMAALKRMLQAHKIRVDLWPTA